MHPKACRDISVGKQSLSTAGYIPNQLASIFLSQKRQEQVSYFNVSHARRTEKFFHEIMGKIEASVF